MLELLLRRTTTILSFKFRILKQLPGIIVRRNFTTTTEKEVELAKDVVLYRHENPRFHMYVSLFAFFQFTFWSFLGVNMLSMKDIPVDTNPNTPFWKKINWGDNYTKKAMAAACILIGEFHFEPNCDLILN